MSKTVIYILSSILVWIPVLIIVLRVLEKSGLALPKNKVTNYILSDQHKLKGGFEPTVEDVAVIFAVALLFRAAVFLVSLSPMFIMNNANVSFESIMNQYMHWDAKWYTSIAEGGYTNHTENGTDYTTLVFFPLYPYLLKFMGIIFRDLRLSGIVTSSLLYAGSCCYLFKLFAIDYNKDTARRAIIYLSIFPFAFFFGAVMTESAMLFTTSATLYYIRKHNWKLVGIFGALAGLARMTGILVAIPAAVEWLEEYEIIAKLKDKQIKEVWKLFYSKGLWIFLMLLGTAIYLLCNYKVTGDPFIFLQYQRKYWYHGSAYFAASINLIYKRMLSDDASTIFQIWIPSAFAAIFVFSCIIYGIRRHRNMYTAFTIVYFIMNLSFDWVISIPRYMTCAIPAFLFLSDMSERNKRTEPFITVIMGILFGIYLTAWICNKQIY